VVIAAKTASEDPRLPGTIHSVAREVNSQPRGGKALAFQLDVQNEKQIEECVNAAVQTFGSCDIVINNASTLWWQSIEDTPANRFDLMYRVNVRGSFLLAKAAIPHMRKRGWGHVICMSPPIEFEEGLRSRVAYNVTKFGMTLVALGVNHEYGHEGLAGNALWPKTVIESSASENFQMGHRSQWRKADILSDCVLALLSQNTRTFPNKAWIDDDLLRYLGYKDKDFVQYRCDPDTEPPSMKELAKLAGDIFERSKPPPVEEREKLAQGYLEVTKGKL
jgi:citronellol/citronellal dehydrogenase